MGRVVLVNETPAFLRGVRYRCSSCGRRLKAYAAVCPACGRGTVTALYRRRRNGSSYRILGALAALVVLAIVFRGPILEKAAPLLEKRFPGFTQRLNGLSGPLRTGLNPAQLRQGNQVRNANDPQLIYTDCIICSEGTFTKEDGTQYFTTTVTSRFTDTRSFIHVVKFYGKNDAVIGLAFDLIRNLEPEETAESQMEITDFDPKKAEYYRSFISYVDKDELNISASYFQHEENGVLYTRFCVYNGYSEPYTGKITFRLLDEEDNELGKAAAAAEKLKPRRIRVFEVEGFPRIDDNAAAHVRFRYERP